MGSGMEQAFWYSLRRRFETYPGIYVAVLTTVLLGAAGYFVEPFDIPPEPIVGAAAGAAVVPTLYAVARIFAAMSWSDHLRQPPPPPF